MAKRGQTLRVSSYTRMVAKAMALNCIRNTVVEKLHREGKISDPEMMAFNKEVTNKVYTFLDCLLNRSKKEKDLFLGKMVGTADPFTSKWDEPEFDANLWQGVEAFEEYVRLVEGMRKGAGPPSVEKLS